MNLMEFHDFREGEKRYEFLGFSPLVETLSKPLGIHSFFGSREGPSGSPLGTPLGAQNSGKRKGKQASAAKMRFDDEN